jgi:hypothetical protein
MRPIITCKAGQRIHLDVHGIIVDSLARELRRPGKQIRDLGSLLQSLRYLVPDVGLHLLRACQSSEVIGRQDGISDFDAS